MTTALRNLRVEHRSIKCSRGIWYLGWVIIYDSWRLKVFISWRFAVDSLQFLECALIVLVYVKFTFINFSVNNYVLNPHIFRLPLKVIEKQKMVFCGDLSHLGISLTNEKSCFKQYFTSVKILLFLVYSTRLFLLLCLNKVPRFSKIIQLNFWFMI